jgi:hypothetical protein
VCKCIVGALSWSIDLLFAIVYSQSINNSIIQYIYTDKDNKHCDDVYVYVPPKCGTCCTLYSLYAYTCLSSSYALSRQMILARANTPRLHSQPLTARSHTANSEDEKLQHRFE